MTSLTQMLNRKKTNPTNQPTRHEQRILFTLGTGRPAGELRAAALVPFSVDMGELEFPWGLSSAGGFALLWTSSQQHLMGRSLFPVLIFCWTDSGHHVQFFPPTHTAAPVAFRDDRKKQGLVQCGFLVLNVCFRARRNTCDCTKQTLQIVK